MRADFFAEGEFDAGVEDDKGACAFSRVTDRVRFVAPGPFETLTLMMWTRVDQLPNYFNVPLRADEAVVGTPHWQFDPKGRLRFGYLTGRTEFLRPDTTEPTDWDVAVSPPVLGPNLGRWIHVATVYDARRAVIEHYVNGEQVATHPLKHPLPLLIGAAQIGNTVVQKTGDFPPQQFNLVGRIDEFALLEAALTPDEIREHYEKGRP